MQQPTPELERQAFAAMHALQALAKMDQHFAIAFMMQGAITLSVEAGMDQKAIAKAFATSMASFERSLKELAAAGPAQTTH